MHICLLFVFVQIPYLGFCACEEMGETGVWQLVDPPILPLTHGPNHSFNWREMLMQDWGICCLALLSFGSRKLQKKYLFLTHTATNPAKRPKKTATTKKHVWLLSMRSCKKCAFIEQMYSDKLLRNEKIQYMWKMSDTLGSSLSRCPQRSTS